MLESGNKGFVSVIGCYMMVEDGDLEVWRFLLKKKAANLGTESADYIYPDENELRNMGSSKLNRTRLVPPPALPLY